MSSVWTALGKPRLERLIGGALLDRLEGLLPIIRPNAYSRDSMYESENLALIFDAFSGPVSLSKKSFRLELYNSLSPKIVDQLTELTGASKQNDAFLTKVSKLAAIPWTADTDAVKIANILGFSQDYVLPTEALPPREQTIDPTDRPYKPLKDYQSTVYFSILNQLSIERSRFVVQMPTGSGKTKTAVESIATHLNDSAEGTIVAWLVHSEELCEQAYDSFLEVWPHVGNKRLKLIRAWGDSSAPPFDFAESSLIVGSFPALHSSLGKHPSAFESLRSRTSLIVVDEAHRVSAPTYNKVTMAFVGEKTSVMGLTATPGRSSESHEENQALADFFFNKVLSIEAGDKPVIEYLRDREVLSLSSRMPLFTHRDFALTQADLKHFETFWDLPPGVLRRLGQDDIRNVEIIKRLEEEAHKGSQILFFACSVEHSKFICAILTILGIKAAHLDGAIPKPRRREILNKFRQSEIQVVCNYGILSTGFDAPKTDVVFISRPTASIVLYSQMIGRGLRGPAIGGTERCTIIDVIDNIIGYSGENEVYDYFQDYYV